MDKNLKVSDSIEINTTVDKLWSAITDREMIKQYFYGTEVTTDWEKGSPITFTGTWQGTTYEDKGFILEIEKEKIIRHSYWSSFWGPAYNPDETSIITYELKKNNDHTVLILTQEGFKDEQSRDHSIGSWNGILNNLKNLLEQ